MNIEKYFVLNKYLLSLFGVIDFKDLQEKLKDAPTTIDSNGRSYFINILRSSFDNIKIPEEILLIYDENIQNYVRKINYKRNPPITLKYFQYLAVLFTEIILDNLKNKKDEFIYNLNEFLEKYKNQQEIELNEFTEDDLKKIAFWMATGSGKTLIMHINYHQFFNYKLFSPNNIILITPNEGLSKQHFEELQESGIPSYLYGGKLSSYNTVKNQQEVLVIEMTKFVEEKKGGGVTLPVDVFGENNLIFVDEGHKGKRSEEQKWAKLRNILAKNGFVFEYSATFGQILSERNIEILEEYAKSIIFDYSYKYFYLDGYGKDFSVFNIKQIKISDREFQETMFVANLLSFYEQLLVYEENQILAKNHNIEKPLWIFVGTTVTGKGEESDIIQIVEFIKRIIQEEIWVKEKIKLILNGNTLLKDENNDDVFENKFKYLKEHTFNLDDLYKKIFLGKGQFSIYELKNSEGEFGLKIGENDYFGVINIGDTSEFKKQLEKKEILVSKDIISYSLFDDIKKDDSPINILIGSKKFIEGWDTWRVSSMGLLNIGKGQGPQIIQLFGRGVRLKGKEMSLKRSAEKTPVQFLEMLNIYGIKADYLNKFLEAISKEEVEFETIEVPVISQHKEKWKELFILNKNEKKKYEEEKVLKLEIDDRIYFTIDLLPKISVHWAKERKQEGIKIEQIIAECQSITLPEDFINLFDWNRILEETYNFIITKRYWNLILDKENLQNLLLSDRYKILLLPEMLEVKNREDVIQLEDIAILVIKKYLDLFYKKHKKRFETENLYYDEVKQIPLPFISEQKQGYILQIDKKEKQQIKEIKKLVKNLKKLQEEDTKILPRVYFDDSLYVPILVQSKKIDKISPVGLVESEKNFVIELRNYLKREKKKFSNIEIYLLRNYPGSGVGFFNLSGFYPDFIMWVKKGKKQFIVFIDPKGLEHIKGLDDEKIKLHQDIKELEKKLGKKNIVLESFILSPTLYEKLTKSLIPRPSKDEYKNHNVLFLEDRNWAEELFNNFH